MKIQGRLLPAALVVASMIMGAVVPAYAQSATPASPPQAAHSMRPGHHGPDPIHALLEKLNLTAEQKTQVKGVQAQTRSQMQSLLASSKSTMEELTTTPPTAPNYATLIATAKANSAAMIQLRSDIWTQIYALLTPAQQTAIPGIVADLRAHHHAWHDRPAAS